MADTLSGRILRQSLDLSYTDIEELHPDWSKQAVDDYFYKQSNINTLAIGGTTLGEQVVINTDNITTNTDGITTNADNLTTHENLTTAHGVTGDNVGTENFASSLVGGVVLLADNIVDVSVTTEVIATSDIGSAPAAYSQTYAQEQTDLINECKTKINSLIDNDVLDLITQLNAFLAANQTANQMAL